ncbi:hypothetical protein BDN70DRAFT_65014 [Pholiota conissans]|uniref:Uncharacterized protein n=1 Tax=Pholiota conissans TaxID=109636 RepID=A0A9P5Z1R3_9AGAR|nr:hypothetical protein BDN70DRAFT_65014 [Pholiota conissans]
MDVSTSIPSSSNISQFSRIRKVTAELSPAQPKSLTPAEMRSKVVEILADTANGCLQELGYYPGMPAKLQASEARNKAWQTENVKLYEDNVRLAANGKAHQEAIRLVNAPEAERIRHIRNLEVENRALKTQIEHMKAKANADLAGKDQAYANLHKEFSHLTESYNLAYQEILRLRDIISGQSPIQPHFQNQAAHQAYQQQSPPISQKTRQIASTGVPQAPSQVGPMPIPTQNAAQGRSYNAPNAQHQLHRIGPEIIQNEELQRQNLFNSSTRVVSGINSMNPPQMQPPYPPPHIQQVKFI